MPNIPHMAFRLRCYLSRSYEKHPLLLLEPLLTGPFAGFSASGPGGPPVKERLQWYLYDNTGACRAVELRRLQALCLSRDKERQLLQELRGLKQGLGRLSDLWLASIKGISLRSLACGQLLASDGVWVVRERSFYAFLPALRISHEQPVEFVERTTGRRINATVLERFALKNSSAGSSAGFDLETGFSVQQFWLCRLHLESAELLCVNQLSFEQNGVCSLYGLRLRSGHKAENGSENREDGADVSVFLFAPSRSIDNYSALCRFLQQRISQLPSVPGASGPEAALLWRQLAADYTGAYSDSLHNAAKSKKGDRNPGLGDGWKRLGGWRLREELWQKAARYAYQRACRFGGYPIAKLETELADQLPLLPAALLQSLLAYLCGKGVPNEGEMRTDFCASCAKVDGYIVAAEGLHPEAAKARNCAVRSGNSAEAPAGNEEWGFPVRISPQGRRLLEALYHAGRQGVAASVLRREYGEAVPALLRSGWAVLHSQSLYCRSCAPRSEAALGPAAPNASDAPKKFSKRSAGLPVGDLSETLRYYKNKNNARKNLSKNRSSQKQKDLGLRGAKRRKVRQRSAKHSEGKQKSF